MLPFLLVPTGAANPPPPQPPAPTPVNPQPPVVKVKKKRVFKGRIQKPRKKISKLTGKVIMSDPKKATAEMQLRVLKEKKLALLELQAQYKAENKIEFFNKPAPEGIPANPPQEELLAAWLDPQYMVFTYTGANRCLGGEQTIYDPVSKTTHRADSLPERFNVWSYSGGRLVIGEAVGPFRKGPKEPIYEVKFSSGNIIRCSAGHRFLTPSGFRALASLSVGSMLSCSSPTSTHVADDRVPPLKVMSTTVIASIKYLRDDYKWDFTVKKYHNYLAGGVINHNTGKTTIGAIIATSIVAGKWLWSGERITFPHNKPRKIRWIGQDWEKHISKVLVPALREWWPRNRPVETKKNNMGVDAFWVDTTTGSSIEIMSNNQDSDLHEGWNGDLIIYDEPPKRDIRVANARGLIDRRGRELFCMTLLKEAWVDREVIKARNEDGTPDTSVYNIHGDIYANVGYGITIEGVNQFMKTLTDDQKDARIKGIPSYMSGLVAKNFERKIHLKRRFEIPIDWIVDIAIDIHPRKEQAILFVATSDRNVRYVVEEVWGHGDGDWVAEQIIRRVKRNLYRVGQVVCDPLAKGDSNNENTTYDKIDKKLAQHGMWLQVASKDKQSGVIELNNHLMGPNNEPSLYIFNDLVRTTYEIEGWQYDKETQKPAKVDDDQMENLYRILLLDTTYEPPAEEDDYEDSNRQSTANSVTGY